ncbi:MAG TPA: hypothetical protein ACFYD7_13140 [Candidatus Wujingus californicus]|uniref:hypothetical protein n=1 Tax=Candidatus Wujingus californicus TaxID=3367618 RepID=UPI0027131680|nr:hypothetical protein [Candidatus Brocadiales bacterium]
MRIGDTWGSIRGIVRDNFSFTQIKDLVGSAGLPVHTLSHLQQRSGGASKGQLMDAIDGLVISLAPDERDRFVSACITEIIKIRPSLVPSLEEVLFRVGWGLSGEEPHPLDLRIDIDTVELSEQIRTSIANCLRRYRDGDISGAITAICGVVDSLTEEQYAANSLGNHRTDSYQVRISKTFSALETEYRRPLDGSNLSPDEINLLWRNHKQAVNQAAYVLASFRRQFSDVHGSRNAPPELLQRAMDCAVFIVRSITTLI